MKNSSTALSFIEEWNPAPAVFKQTARLISARAQGVTFHFEGDGWSRITSSHAAATAIQHCFPYNSIEMRCLTPATLEYRDEEAKTVTSIHIHHTLSSATKAHYTNQQMCLLLLTEPDASLSVAILKEKLTHPLWCIIHKDNVLTCSPELTA